MKTTQNEKGFCFESEIFESNYDKKNGVFEQCK